jgi:hypothetical protein
MADDKRLERIEVKIDDISDHLGSIDVTLGAQHVSLKEHIRRTALIESELLPIKKHVNMIQGAIALITVLATIAGLVKIFTGK